MKKVLKLLILAFYSQSVFADQNPMFGEYNNQISITGGQSFRGNFRSGFEREDLFFGSITYSQPATFFRLHAKQNIELGAFKAKSNTSPVLNQYNLALFGISEDIALFHVGNFYTTAGLGAYIKNRSTNRISSQFTFGEKIAVGYRYSSFNLELYARHFSNGTLTDQNTGQNFCGLSIAANF